MHAREIVDVQALYGDGVRAISALTESFTKVDWDRVVCGRWTAEETARHVVGVIGWYHDWLDRAIFGDSRPPFAHEALDAQNDAVLETLGNLSGPDAIAIFTEQAELYIERLVPHWDRPFGFPMGTVSAGLHCGIAATEWHLHAWDLTTGRPTRHEPANPRGLFIAAGMGVAAARGGLQGIALRTILPVVSRISPWTTILRESGRGRRSRQE